MALTTSVRSARSESERQAVVAVITLAFSTDPMARWTFPDPATYLKVWPEVVRAFGDKGFAHGAAHRVSRVVESAEHPALPAARVRDDRNDPGGDIAGVVPMLRRQR